MSENGVNVKRYKALKSVGIAFILLGLYWIGVRAGADPRTMLWPILGAILLVAGVELSELATVRGIKIVREEDEDS